MQSKIFRFVGSSVIGIAAIGLSSTWCVKTSEIKNQPKDRTKKREHYLKWEDYFMGVALVSGQRSKDPNTQVGACIVNEDKRIVGVGYNGFPIGCSDDVFPWSKHTSDPIDSKSMYVVHAEENAILNRFSADLKKSTIYVTFFPCNRCAQVIIQSGIKNIVYMSDKKKNTKEVEASKRMLDAAGVQYVQYKPSCKRLLLNFTDFDDQKIEF